MDLEKAIGAIEKFFFDLIGNVIPGGILVAGLLYCINPSIPQYYLLSKDIPTIAWLSLISMLFVVGYALSSAAKFFTMFIYFLKYGDKNGFRSQIKDSVFLKERFCTLAEDLSIPGRGYDDAMGLRNYILSRIKPEDNLLTRRFRFISLLNINTATALIIIVLSSGISSLLWKNMSGLGWGESAIAVVCVFLFVDRFIEFDMRTHMLPFQVWSRENNPS